MTAIACPLCHQARTKTDAEEREVIGRTLLNNAEARIAELKATILFERQANERNCAELLAAKRRGDDLWFELGSAQAHLRAVIALCDKAIDSMGDYDNYRAPSAEQWFEVRAAAAGKS